MSYSKTALADIKVGDYVNLADDSSNGHDFKFVDARVSGIVPATDLFGDPCVDLLFGNRRERFATPCAYLFDVLEVPDELI